MTHRHALSLAVALVAVMAMPAIGCGGAEEGFEQEPPQTFAISEEYLTSTDALVKEWRNSSGLRFKIDVYGSGQITLGNSCWQAGNAIYRGLWFSGYENGMRVYYGERNRKCVNGCTCDKWVSTKIVLNGSVFTEYNSDGSAGTFYVYSTNVDADAGT